MVGMLSWPSRTSSAESTSARWDYDQNSGLALTGLGAPNGFPDVQSGEQVFFAPMDFPVGTDKAAFANNSPSSRDRNAVVRGLGFDPAAQPPPSQDVYGKLFQNSRDRIGLTSSLANGFAPLSSQFEASSDSNGISSTGEAIFQPVMDSASLEPLDEKSLELLVSSLSQINSDSHLSQLSSNQMSDGDGALASASNAPMSLNEYMRRSPDLSESFSDSSSISSNSPRDSSFKQEQSGAGATGSTASSASAAAGVRKKPKRIRRLCTQPNCGKRARSLGLCIAHGGGRRCAVDGCEKSSQGGNMCIKHGGGKRCSVAGCNKAAQTNALCKAHGGGPRCQIDGCNKSSQGGGFCRSHGGGKRCATEGCDKGTQRGDYCALHGGSRFCEVSGCRRNDRGGGLCAHHGGGKRCGILNCARPCRRNGFCSTHLRLLGGGDDSA